MRSRSLLFGNVAGLASLDVGYLVVQEVMVEGGELPTGAVTFLFTDVEGSTSLWASDPDAMATSLRLHDRLARTAIEGHGGYVFTTAGDSFAAAFQLCGEAVSAAEAIQHALTEADWGAGPALTVRIGLHVGEAEERDGDYFGPPVNLAARVEAAGHGGQVLMTDAVARLVDQDLVDLGEYRLRGFETAVGLYQLGRGSFPRLRSEDPGAPPLPRPRSSLVGRIGDVAQIRDLLRVRRLVTLTGVGGCGKTRLALATAHVEADGGTSSVFFVDLRSADEPGIMSAFASATGVQLDAKIAAVDQVVRLLARRPALVVVDNCEHLLDSVAEVLEELLDRCSDLTVLATSREALDVEGEEVWRVASLHIDDAIRLFVDRASPAPQTVSQASQMVAEICDRLDGIPLALELAAARARAIPVEEIRDRLDERFRLLTGGRRRDRQRQQTLETTVRWSYDLLDERERQGLRALSVFRGGFDLGDVGPILDIDHLDAIEIVDSLAAKSLVEVGQSADGRVRHHLLETIRLFSVQELASTNEADGVRTRHLQHLVDEQAHLGWMAGLDRHGDERRAREFDNLAAANRWAIETGRSELSVRLAAHLAPLYVARGEAREALDLITQDAALGRDDAVLAHAAAAYIFMSELADPTTAIHHMESGLEAAGDDAPNPVIMPVLLQTLMLAAQGRLVEADENWRHCYELARRTPSPSANRAYLLDQQAILALNMHLDGRAALAYSDEASRLAPGIGFWVTGAVPSLALLHLGRIEEARSATSQFNEVSGSPWAFLHQIIPILIDAHAHGPDAAATTLAPIAAEMTGRRAALIGEFLAAFAYLAMLRGDDAHALRLAENSWCYTKLISLQTAVRAKVRGWPADQIANERVLAFQQEPMAERAERITTNQPGLFADELATWTRSTP